ncbi:protein DMP7-like [Prosopis cineraria]|uniref:protein DMP7-like n=1 Tax=Prosopis cineraria TaxID=364024 RepID=UPI00240F69FA|nr:protein DMP7-like [Prosopis cineraria]
MEVIVNTQESQQPLLENAPLLKQPKTPTQKVIRKTFKSTANLSNLLPTGSVLAFQILSPIVTHQGQCKTHTSQTMTACLLAMCSMSCFLLSFTDSFRDERGKVRYGFATWNGLWVIDGSAKLSAQEAAKFRLNSIDFFHACASILVFFAVAMLDKNVVMCFEPNPSDEERDLLVTLPVGIGLLCSFLFIIFPTKRHGIGFPLSRD